MQVVALAVKQRMAASVVGRDDERVRVILEELQSDTTQALEDLRDLARGVYPPPLADEGLVAALEAQARKSTVPVDVMANGIGRFPQEMEAAVYFSCLEALQNVAKYEEASGAVIRLANVRGTSRWASSSRRLHHGTDHRSQVCTALTALGVEPPPIDVLDFGIQAGRVVEITPTP
jgi:signal transduction histidine kinase